MNKIERGEYIKQYRFFLKTKDLFCHIDFIKWLIKSLLPMELKVNTKLVSRTKIATLIKEKGK